MMLTGFMGLRDSVSAYPPEYRVTRQRAAIEAIQPADAKTGTPGSVSARSVGREKGLSFVYTIRFADPQKIDARTRARSPRKLAFGDLRVGMELEFTGSAVGSWITPDRVMVFIP